MAKINSRRFAQSVQGDMLRCSQPATDSSIWGAVWIHQCCVNQYSKDSKLCNINQQRLNIVSDVINSFKGLLLAAATALNAAMVMHGHGLHSVSCIRNSQ